MRRTEEGGRVFRGEDEDAGEREKGEGVGGCVASREEPGEEEAARQGGGGRGAWPRAPGACPSSWQRRKATGG